MSENFNVNLIRVSVVLKKIFKESLSSFLRMQGHQRYIVANIRPLYKLSRVGRGCRIKNPHF
jgi:hypothetical protein